MAAGKTAGIRLSPQNHFFNLVDSLIGKSTGDIDYRLKKISTGTVPLRMTYCDIEIVVTHLLTLVTTTEKLL